MKKILTTGMAFVLAFSICCTTAFATENSVTVSAEDDTMTFTTSLLMSETAITAPEVDFTYTISTGDIYGTDSVETVTAPTITTTAFTTEDSVDPTAEGVQYLSKNATVTFDTTTFTTTGIYHYTITATDMSSVDGVVMDDDTTREIYVYVLEDEHTTGSYYISNIVMTTAEIASTTVTAGVLDDTAANEKSEGFINGYGINPDSDPGTGDDPDEVYEDFIVTLNVDGNMADRNKDFTIAITSTSGISDGTIFTVTDEDGDTQYIKWDATNSKFITVTYTAAAGETPASWTEGNEFSTISLKDGETYTIHSVVNDMVFVTTITDADNYTIYSNIDSENKSADETLVLTNTINTQNQNENDSNNYIPTYDLTIPDTGVLIDFLPFVLIVLISAGVIVLRVATSRRKRAK